MAYTKTPEQDTHSKYRIAPKGNQSRTSIPGGFEAAQGSKYVNCYPMVIESKTTDPSIVLVKAPNIKTKTWTFPDTDVGIGTYDFETNVFSYKNKIYQVEASGTSGPTISLRETFAAPGTVLSCQKVINYSAPSEILMAGLFYNETTNNTNAYTYNVTTDTLTIGDVVANNATVYSTPSGYSDEIYVQGTAESASPRDLFIDGYHIVALKAALAGTNRVLISNTGVYNTFATSTDYFVPEIDPDDLVDIQKHKNFICVLGTKTIEFFYNAAAEIGSPFVRQENRTIRLGAAQNVSANGGAVSIANGDDIYFFANALHGSNSIYLIRDFTAIKISDDYIDALLNTSTGVIGTVDPATAKLGLIDIMGNVHLGVEFNNTSTGAITTFVFNERDKIWWEWSNSDTSGLQTTTNGIVSNFLGNPVFIRAPYLGVSGFAQYSVAGASTSAGSTVDVYYISKDPNDCAVTAEYITPIQDLESNNYKHLKFVDAIGDYGNNQIKLAYCKTPNYASWSSFRSKYPSITGTRNAVRWHNLGHSRRFALRSQFIGTSNIAHSAFEVAYNIGSQ